MFKTEIEYRKDTLFVQIFGPLTRRNISKLKRKLYYILTEYGINHVVMNISEASPFDKEEFYKNHIYDEGYFNDKRDGFGPVCNNYEDTVSTIVNMLKNDCKLEKKYENRIKNFFKYDDHNNCKRVYEAIKKIDR